MKVQPTTLGKDDDMECTITLYDTNGMEHHTMHFDTSNTLGGMMVALNDGLCEEAKLDFCFNCRKYKDADAFMVEVPNEATTCIRCSNIKAHKRWLRESDDARLERVKGVLDKEKTV